MSRKVIGVGVIGGLLAMMAVSLSLAQQGGAGGGAGGAGGTGTRRGEGTRTMDPAQMQRMMEQRMQEQLGATAEEWKTLGPRVMKVNTLSRQLSSGSRGGMFARGGRRGADQATPAAEQTALEKATDQLRTTLENTSATPEQIKTQLTALRQAKEKAKKELAAAQADLRKGISGRREAQLVLMGLLD